MRLLLDQNLPYSITKALAADCDVVHTEDVALQQVTDPEIFSYCVATERVLVTADRPVRVQRLPLGIAAPVGE